MEGQNVSKPAVFNMLGGAFSIFFKKLHIILGLVVLGGGISLALMYLWAAIPVISVGGTIGTLVLSAVMGIIYALIGTVFGVIFGLAMLKVLIGAIKGKDVGFESISYGFKNVWGGFMVSLRVFYYVMFWPLLFLMGVLLAFAIFNTVGGASVGIPVSGSGFVDPSITPVAYDPGAMSLRSTIFKGGNMFLGLLGFVAVIMTIYFALVRGLRATFSLYAYVAEGKKGKDALEYSKSLVKGNWWMVFWKLLAAVLLLFVVLFAVALVGGLINGGDFSFALGSEQISTAQPLWKNGLNQLFSGLLGALVVAYASHLFMRLKGMKKM